MQGRVNATFKFIGLGATLLGALLAGQLGERYGLRALIVSGVMMPFLAALWLWLSPVERVRTLAEEGWH